MSPIRRVGSLCDEEMYTTAMESRRIAYTHGQRTRLKLPPFEGFRVKDTSVILCSGSTPRVTHSYMRMRCYRRSPRLLSLGLDGRWGNQPWHRRQFRSRYSQAARLLGNSFSAFCFRPPRDRIDCVAPSTFRKS